MSVKEDLLIKAQTMIADALAKRYESGAILPGDPQIIYLATLNGLLPIITLTSNNVGDPNRKIENIEDVHRSMKLVHREIEQHPEWKDIVAILQVFQDLMLVDL